MANKNPPWAAYQTYMSGRLIALDKLTGVHMVEAGETWVRLFSKWALNFRGPEDIHACKDYHICARLKALRNGEVHRVKYIWYAKSTEEN